jgi:hypothetical protein
MPKTAKGQLGLDLDPKSSLATGLHPTSAMQTDFASNIAIRHVMRCASTAEPPAHRCATPLARAIPRLRPPTKVASVSPRPRLRAPSRPDRRLC